MAVDTLRAGYNAATILIHEGAGIAPQMPTFSDRYTIYGNQFLNTSVPTQTAFPMTNDFALVNHINRFGRPALTLSQFPIYSGGMEYRVRQELAQLGFKPDGAMYRKGHPLTTYSMSRVADLEPVSSARNGYVHTNVALLSHVVPYTLASFVATSTVMGVAANGWGGNGFFAPFPWPRILTAWRVFDVTNNRRHAPRGSKAASITSSGPDWVAIRPDGTLRVSTNIDLVRFSNAGAAGSVAGLVPGNSYEIQIGHSEPFAGTNTAPNQRWFSAAFGNQDWFTGTPIPA